VHLCAIHNPKSATLLIFFSPTYTRCPYNVPLGRQQHRVCVCVCVCYTSVATLVVPGLCSFCPPHCQASARRANRNAHWFFARFLTVQNVLFRTLSTHNNSSQTSSWHGASTHRHSGSPSRRSFDVSRAFLRNRTLSSASAAAHSTFRRRQNAVGHHRESFAHNTIAVTRYDRYGGRYGSMLLLCVPHLDRKY